MGGNSGGLGSGHGGSFEVGGVGGGCDDDGGETRERKLSPASLKLVKMEKVGKTSKIKSPIGFERRNGSGKSKGWEEREEGERKCEEEAGKEERREEESGKENEGKKSEVGEEKEKNGGKSKFGFFTRSSSVGRSGGRSVHTAPSNDKEEKDNSLPKNGQPFGTS